MSQKEVVDRIKEQKKREKKAQTKSEKIAEKRASLHDKWVRIQIDTTNAQAGNEDYA